MSLRYEQVRVRDYGTSEGLWEQVRVDSVFMNRWEWAECPYEQVRVDRLSLGPGEDRQGVWQRRHRGQHALCLFTKSCQIVVILSCCVPFFIETKKMSSSQQNLSGWPESTVARHTCTNTQPLVSLCYLVCLSHIS